MVAVQAGPPQRPAAQGRAAARSEQELQKPARLETAVTEVAVIAGAHAEATDLHKNEAEHQAQGAFEQCHAVPEDCERQHVHGQVDKAHRTPAPTPAPGVAGMDGLSGNSSYRVHAPHPLVISATVSTM